MKKPAQPVIDRYFAHQCTAEEAAQVLDWLATAEGQAYYARILDERIAQFDHASSHAGTSPMDDEKLLQSIYAQAAAIELKKISQRKPMIWYSVAAAVALLLVGGYAYWSLLYSRTVEYSTGYGEVRTITLSDSSVVTLNANSTLSYHDQKVREVFLEGEAYFSVQHKPDHTPFVVHAGQVNVQVLGTEFNVSSRRKETKVVLSSGKVKLDINTASNQQEMMMEPGELATYAEDQSSVTKQVVNTRNYIAWRHNQLIFDHTPLSEIAQLLEDNYGLQVVAEDPAILALQFSGEVAADETDLLLKLIEKSFNLSITKTKTQVLMRKN